MKTKSEAVYTMETWAPMLEAMHSGEVFEMDAHVWNYWLGVLPPVEMGRPGFIDGKPVWFAFGFAEGPEPITDFWTDGGRYFGKRSDRINRGD